MPKLGFISRLVGDSNDKEVKRLSKTIAEINALDAEMKALSDDELSAKTAEFKAAWADGDSLDDLLPEAFAVARQWQSLRCRRHI